MKTIAMILVTLFMAKSCSQEAKNNIANASLEYSANTRGFFQKIQIANQKATISKDRSGKETPKVIDISDADWKELVSYFKTVKLDSLGIYKDPTQKRFYDGAANADLKVNYKGKEYKTVTFDHGFPPAEIEKLVDKIVSIGKEE